MKKYYYFDNASTSYPKAPDICDFSELVNPSKGAYDFGIKSAKIIYQCRREVADFFGLKDCRRVIFTSGATMSANMLLQGFLRYGDVVVLSNFEHNSIYRCVKFLEKKLNLELRFLRRDEDLNIDFDYAKKALKGARLLISTHANNVCGKVSDIDMLSQIAKENNCYFLLDAAQSAGTFDLSDVMKRVDFLCFSAHKGMLALSGLGALLLNDKFDVNLLDSFMYGGTSSDSENELMPAFLPDKYEAGSLNFHSIYSLYKSLQFIKNLGVKNIYEHNLALRNQLVNKLSGVKIYEFSNCINNVCIQFTNHPVDRAAAMLNEAGICVRAGLHCSILTHKLLKTYEQGGSIRIAIGVFNTSDEIDYLLDVIRRISRD